MISKIKIISTIISAIVFILIAGHFLPKRKDAYFKEKMYLEKTFANPDFDIIIMGDSRAVHDISPEIIEDSLPGFQVLNFGFSNGGLNDYIFNKALSKFNTNSKPKVLILSVTALTIHYLSFNNKHYKTLRKTPKEERLELEYFSPLLNYFAVDFKALAGKPEWHGMKQIFHNSGWIETYVDEPDTSYAIPYYVDDYVEKKVDYAHLHKIAKTVHRLTQQGIKVVCFRPPTTIEMKLLEENSGGFNEDIVKKELTAAGAIWIPLNFQDYSSFDGSHLDANSAIKLSSIIATNIKKCLPTQTKQ